MIKRGLEPVLVLGLATALALSAVTPSLGQATQQQQCWIPTAENDQGAFGYWGSCSTPRARQVQ
jgi:hypothetical protein